MASSGSNTGRVCVDGKFFRAGERKFYVKGVAYGPVAVNADGEPFPDRARVRDDFVLMGELGANVVRTYHVPPGWFLDLAQEQGLKLLIDLPVNKYRCYLEGGRALSDAARVVRDGVKACRGHGAVFAYSVTNEIPPDVARWGGARQVAERIDVLVEAAKSVEAGALCTFANFPPTEYVRPRHVDFVSFNVYLHQRRAMENYVARLQMSAEGKPLLLSECGADAIREGDARQAALVAEQVEVAFRGGMAGVVVFGFTDDWVAGGRAVEDWGMGLTTRDRQRKESFHALRRQFERAPFFPLAVYPRVSVVVACYNGAKTLQICLDSLQRLNYPDYEVILVDDGSTDATPQIAAQHDNIRYLAQSNRGLSAARNAGVAAATGEVVAFLDADCRADEDWLYYLVADLWGGRYGGMGGPNLAPPEDSSVAAAVLVSPGGPAHVMLTDRLAEHIPGCNMAFYKRVLEEVGGFDPIFRRAGDDVDICWRVQQRGYRIGFSPAAFVWHYRRSTVRAYLRQQQGYGEAEAMLERKHPEYFNSLGGNVWRGRIYTASKDAVVPRRSVIYHGVFGTGFFQTVYASEPAMALMLATTLEFHVLVTLPLLVLSAPFPFLWPLPLTSLLVSVGLCATAAAQADIPSAKRRWWSRFLVALLFFLQPLVRGWARYRGRLTQRPGPLHRVLPGTEAGDDTRVTADGQLYYWADQVADRLRFLGAVLDRLDGQGWTSKADGGWEDYDLEVHGGRWARLQLTTALELYPGGRSAIRCRLRSSWSLGACLVFWGLLCAELLLIGFGAKHQPYLWMLLLTLPVVGWRFDLETAQLRRRVAGLLGAVAAEQGLTRVDPGSLGAG